MKQIGMIQIQSIYIQARLVKISNYYLNFDQNIFYTFEMRSTPINLRPKIQRLLCTRSKSSQLNNQSLTHYTHIDFALQTLDNSHSLMLLQSLEDLPPHHLCLKTKLAHLLDQHHSCLLFSTHSLLVTPLCPPCLDIYFQHLPSNQQWNPTLRSKLIESLSQKTKPQLLKYLMKLTQFSPKVSRYRNLMEELRRDQCFLDKMEILEVQDNYRKILASENIKKDEQILFIPKDKLITLELARTLPLVQKLSCKRGHLKSPKHTELAVYMLHQFQKGQQSPFYNYLSTLPTDFSHFPINYSQEMMKELQGTCLLEQIETKKLDLKKDYQIVLSVDEKFGRFSFERFVEVRLLVCSRVFGIIMDRAKTDAMVPLADMLNHQIPKQTSWYYCDISKGFVIQSLQDITAGCEIFDSYGQKCNSRFLLNYGFTLPSNTHNQVTLILNLSPFFKSNHIPSNVRLRINRILESKSFQDMMSALRIAASFKQVRECESEEEESLGNVKHMAFKSIQNQIKAMQLLENLILERLKDYPTTLIQDKRLLDKAKGVLADIITLRMGEKEVFHYYLTMAKKICKFLANRSKRSDLAAYQTYIASLQLEGRDEE